MSGTQFDNFDKAGYSWMPIERLDEILAVKSLSVQGKKPSVQEIRSKFKGSSVLETQDAFQARMRKFRLMRVPSFATLKLLDISQKQALLRDCIMPCSHLHDLRAKYDRFKYEAREFLKQHHMTEESLGIICWAEWMLAIDLVALDGEDLIEKPCIGASFSAHSSDTDLTTTIDNCSQSTSMTGRSRNSRSPSSSSSSTSCNSNSHSPCSLSKYLFSPTKSIATASSPISASQYSTASTTKSHSVCLTAFERRLDSSEVIQTRLFQSPVKCSKKAQQQQQQEAIVSRWCARHNGAQQPQLISRKVTRDYADAAHSKADGSDYKSPTMKPVMRISTVLVTTATAAIAMMVIFSLHRTQYLSKK